MKQDETISPKQAAAILKRSVATVYRSISQGKLQAVRIGGSLFLKRAEVCALALPPRGRIRSKHLCWHRPTDQAQGVTVLQGCIRQGAHQHFHEQMQEIQGRNAQLFGGETACYLTACAENPSRICLLIVWYQVALSAEQERQAAISALQAELAQVLVWDNQQEQVVLLHAY